MNKIKFKTIRTLILLFQINTIWLLPFYFLYNFLISYITNNYIFTDSIYYNYLGDQLSFDKISEIINFNSKLHWIGYLTGPFIYLLKFFSVSICILTGLMLSDLKIYFSKVFKIVLISEIIFILAITIKTLYFLIYKTNFTMDEFQTYYPLSLINYLDSTKLESWLKYPLQLVNIFELAYILLIASGLSIVLRIKYMKSFKIVSLSYLIGMLILITFITFLFVNTGS